MTYEFPAHMRESRVAKSILTKLTLAGADAYLVGGCVRDEILRIIPNDYDIATNLLPDQVTQILEKEGYKVIPTGIEHGTVTAVDGRCSIEITTFRKDVECDGRRAVVAFTNDMKEDAYRRDFTMNALYKDATGRVYDPTGAGLSDLLNGTVRFVGSPCERIEEDYLRILRYFRFYARFGNPNIVDSSAVYHDEFRKYAPDLFSKISGERIWKELRGILNTRKAHVDEVIRDMVSCELLPEDLDWSKAAIYSPKDFGDLWPARYVALGLAIPIPYPTSKKDNDLVTQIQMATQENLSDKALGHKYGRIVAQYARMGVDDFYSSDDMFVGEFEPFPVSAQSLMDMGYEGKAIGDTLNKLKDEWYKSDLTLSEKELLAML